MKSKLTITVDADLIPAAKRYARSRGVTLSSLVEKALREATEATDGGPASFNATLDFDGMGLPADAPVTIEAYRGRMAMRFPWGAVGELAPPLDRRLVSVPDNPSFRVKVAASDGSGLLLAMANRIRPRREESRGSLLWLKSSDALGKEVWRLEFGDGNPTLLINSNVHRIEDAALNDGAFQGLVLPEAMRAVLIHALIVDDADLEDDGMGAENERGDWSEWLRFAGSFHDEPLPSGDDAAADRAAKITWVDAAVAEFTQKRFRASDAYETASERK